MVYLQILFLSLFSMTSPLLAEQIIFDLFGVLIDIPTRKKIGAIGVKDALGYSIKEKENILTIKTTYLDMLSKISVDLSQCQYLKGTSAQGKAMPDIMIAWQAGIMPYTEALAKIQGVITEREAGIYEKRLLNTISNATFDLTTRTNTYRLKKAGVKLLSKLAAETDANGQKRHRLFVMSNMDHEMIERLKKAYPDIFGLFEDVVYSAETKSLKPHPHIYQTLLERNKLDPAQCVMIDDQQENVDAAKQLGMQGIVFRKHLDLRYKLIIKGLLSHKVIGVSP